MKKGKFKKIFWLCVLGFVIIVLVFIWVFVVGIRANKTGQFYNKGTNAIWIAHEWANEAKSDAEIRDLVKLLSSHDINTIYLHVGPLEGNGRISPAVYKETVNFVEKVKRSRGDMKIFAWMGQLREKIDLGDPVIRHNIISMAVIFTEMIGMDGIQYDIEPVWDEDSDFIKLLAETRDVFNKNGGEISVALSEFIPGSFIWLTGNIFGFENYNTEKNYLNVAKYADQIVDMVYDTGIGRDYLYEWLIKEEVIWVSDLMGDVDDGVVSSLSESETASGTEKSVAGGVSEEPASGGTVSGANDGLSVGGGGMAGNGGKKVEFLIGIPAYDEVKEGFNPEVENVKNALIGIINGLNDIRSHDENFTGVAIYPEWQMDKNEWGIYDALWGTSLLRSLL